MIAALVLVFVFAALMFLVLAFSANLRVRRARTLLLAAAAREGRDRCLTVAAVLAGIALGLAIEGVFL